MPVSVFTVNKGLNSPKVLGGGSGAQVADGGARRLGFRSGGGVQRWLGVAMQRRLGCMAAQVVEQLG